MSYEPIRSMPRFKVSVKTLSEEQIHSMLFNYLTRMHPSESLEYAEVIARNIAGRLVRNTGLHKAVGFVDGIPRVLCKYDNWDRFSSYPTVNVNSFNKIFNFK